MFQRCGEQWRRRYLEGEKTPPGISGIIGKGVHKGSEINLKSKLQTGQDLPLDVLQDVAAEGYDKALSNGVFIPADELPGAKIVMAEGKDATVSLATLYHNEVAPKIRPTLVEEKVTINLPEVELPIVTVLDCYDEDKILHETKTSGKRWVKSRAHTSPQPPLYREAVKEITGEYPKSSVFDILVNNKTPVLQRIETFRGEDEIKILAQHFNIMLNCIKAGIFPPAQPDHWCCSMKYCGYFFTCPHIPAHRKILPKRSS